MAERENIRQEWLLGLLPEEADPRFDAGRIVVGGSRPWVLKPIWVGEGLPADIRRAIELLEPVVEREIPVFMGRALTRGARSMLDERRFSWADETGRAVIRSDSDLFIARLPVARKAKRQALTWTEVVAATAEVALITRSEDRSQGARIVPRPAVLASATGYSYQQTSKALALFDQEGYTAKVGAERGPTAMREFRDASRFLSEWTGDYARTWRLSESSKYQVPWRNHEASLDLLNRTLSVEWSVSGGVAADRIAPYLSALPEVVVYVANGDYQQARADMAGHEDVLEVEDGGRISIRPAPTYLIRMSTTSGGVNCVPPERVYADLVQSGGRGAEAAEHLRESALGY